MYTHKNRKGKVVNTQIRAERTQIDGSNPDPGRPKAKRLGEHPNDIQYNTNQNPIETSGNVAPGRRIRTPPESENSCPDRVVEPKPDPWRVAVSSSTAAPGDLRRRDRRDYARTLLDRAAWLPAGDRELVEAVFGEGLSVIAYLRRCRDRGLEPASTRGAPAGGSVSARMARRRLRRLVERVLSPRFAFVVTHRTSLGATRRRVAMACIVQGRSLREAAGMLGLSLHAVRRHIDAVEALFTAERERKAGGEGACRG